jgi:protein subunit release factor B
MENDKKIPSRRKFVLGFGVLSALAAIGITFTPKKIIVSCDPSQKKKTIKMLTQDGKLVEIEEDKLKSQRKKITDEELKSWVKKS